MIFGEVVHYVAQPTGWPEPVRSLASLLPPFHCPDRPGSERHASPSEPLTAPEASAPSSYAANDFQGLVHSTAAGLSALAALPHYGGERSTVPLWSQLLHALANTLFPEILILEDAPFIMPRAQSVASQPSNLIDGHATLLAAHAIFATPRTHSERSGTGSERSGTGSERSGTNSERSRTSSERSGTNSERSGTGSERSGTSLERSGTSSGNEEDEDESRDSADSDSCHDSADSLDLPFQAHMLPGQGRRLSAVVPVLLVADSHNIVPLLCSTLYQRYVWGIRQPVVGLCCSSTGTIATAIFGWLDSDQSEEGRMPTAHLALASDDLLDPLMGVFDFTDTCSAISLAQFVLGLRSHVQDIKGNMSIEAVDSVTPLHWRSDLPDFETQLWGRLDERLASWNHQVHVETSSSGESSSSTPRTPFPLSDPVLVSYKNMSSPFLGTIVEDERADDANTRLPQETRAGSEKSQGRGSQPSSIKVSSQRSNSLLPKSHSKSRYSNSTFAALTDTGLKNQMSISNWLFERHAFTVGRLPLASEEHESGINDMVKTYDQMTVFTWSDEIHTILSDATVDKSVLDIRSELCTTYASPNCQSSAIDAPSSEDVEFISGRISALLHIVKGARNCEGVAQLQGANEADGRHEWNALLLNFFQPVPGQRDVLLERQVNLARNIAADNSSFATQAGKAARDYMDLCLKQYDSLPFNTETSSMWEQALAAFNRAVKFHSDLVRRLPQEEFAQVVASHSFEEPIRGKCDAVLVTPCSGAATKMPQGISSIDEQEDFLRVFMLIQGPKPEKIDASVTMDETSSQIEKAISHSRKTTSDRSLQVLSSHASEPKTINPDNLSNLFDCHPDRHHITTPKIKIMRSKNASSGTPSTKDLLLPVLLVEFKKKNESAISIVVNKMRTYMVSALTFLSELGITDEPVFGLVVDGTRGAVTMAWKKEDKIYVMDRNVRYYDITNPLEALQFVSILLRLARHGARLSRLLKEEQLTSRVTVSKKPSRWSRLAQRQEDDELAAAQQSA